LIGYLGIKGENIEIFKNWNLRKLAVLATIILVIFVGFFVATKNESFWQKIPGLGRLAQFSLSDANFRTRLISLGVSWNAINPSNEGLQRFLFGWGPENFSIAYNKYYNPEYFKYETSWFDRAHNKLMDVLVMNGLFGLISYLFLWLFVVIAIFKISKKNLFLSSATIFFATSYFVQNLTVFESLPTYVILYAFFGFLISDSLNEGEEKNTGNELLGIIISMVVGILLVIGFVWTTAIPYLQIKGYIAEKTSKENVQTFKQNIEKYLSPYTYAQENIRTDLLTAAQALSSKYGLDSANGETSRLYKKALDSMEELVNNEPYNARYYLRLAVSYNNLGKELNDNRLLDQSITYAEKALNLTPNRQDVMYVLGYSYLLSNRVKEAVDVYKKALDADNSVASSNFYYGVALASAGYKNYKTALNYLEYSVDNGYSISDNENVFVNVYKTFANYFATQKDLGSYVKVLKRLVNVGVINSVDAQRSIEAISSGNWQAAKTF
jgi:tetratricopeptide (TPR) repeat protein